MFKPVWPLKACLAKQPRESSSSELCVKSTGLGKGGGGVWSFRLSTGVARVQASVAAQGLPCQTAQGKF